MPLLHHVRLSCGVVAVSLMALAGQLQAQTDSVITVDLVTRQLSASPPFDQRFRLRATMPKGADSLRLEYGPVKKPASPSGAVLASTIGTSIRRVGGLLEATSVDFIIQEMPPNKEYLFRFTVFGKKAVPETDPAKAIVGTKDTVIGERLAEPGGRRDTTRYIRPVKPVATRDSVVAETLDVLATAAANHTSYFDNDFGVLFTGHNPGPGYIGAGSNVHLHFAPVNRKERKLEKNVRDQLLKRVSVFGGLAFVRIHATEEVKNQFDVGNFVYGLGYRPHGLTAYDLQNFIRLNVGMMYFKQDAANPLVTEDITKHAPFISITGDVSLKELLGPVASLLGIKG